MADKMEAPWAGTRQVPYSTMGYGGGTMLLSEAGACIGYVIVLNKSEHHDSKLLDAAVHEALGRALPPADVSGEAWRDIASAPVWEDDENVLVVGGRFSKPTLVRADGDYWRADRLRRVKPSHFLRFPTPPSTPAAGGEK